MKLSPSQEQAKLKILDFLLGPNQKNNLFLLKGSAGTGKSTLVSHILKGEEFQKKSIVMSATTNKAVSILQKMSHERYENMDVLYLTIHKLLQIKRKINRDGEALYLSSIESKYQKKAKSIFNYDIIVIDESSMINEEMMQSIMKIQGRIKGKIIFLGDRAQLPPVNEVESSIFNLPIPHFELVEIMRYRGNLVLLANKFRDLVFNRKTKITFKDYREKYLKTSKNFAKWIQKYLQEINKLKSVETLEIEKIPIFLVYTNRMCDLINREVRQNLFENVTDKYISGEIIIFNNYYYHMKSDCKYYTSQKMEVKLVLEKEYQFNLSFKLLEKLDKIFATFMRNNSENYIDMISYQEDCHTKLHEVIETLHGLNVPYYELTLQNEKPIWVLHPSMEKEFSKIIEEVRDKLQKFKKYNQKKYGKTKDIKNLIDSFMICIWEEFYSEVVDIFADISYGYCITTHKSQGSTFKSVYIDLNNIIEKNSNEEESYRCLYTAVTRSSKKINILLS